MDIATVYYSGTLKEYLSIKDDTVVNVSDSPPQTFEVLVKCHPKLTDLTPDGDGGYTAVWEVLKKYPIEKKIGNG